MDNTKNSAQKLSIFTESAQKIACLKAITEKISKQKADAIFFDKSAFRFHDKFLIFTDQCRFFLGINKRISKISSIGAATAGATISGSI